jgi:hypothetical protein
MPSFLSREPTDIEYFMDNYLSVSLISEDLGMSAYHVEQLSRFEGYKHSFIKIMEGVNEENARGLSQMGLDKTYFTRNSMKFFSVLYFLLPFFVFRNLLTNCREMYE